MANKKTIKLVLSSFIALGVMVFSHISNNSINEMHADELIGTPSVSWDNIDYAGFGPHEVGGIPQEGYCVLVQYPSDISSTLYTTQSLLTMDVPGCNVKDHILINGVESQNVEDTIIYCYPYNGLYIYIPHNSITFTDEYENVTIDVLEGMSIDGSVQTVASTFEFRGLIRSMGGWLVNPAPIEKIQGEFTRIDWNNQDYSYTLKEEWCFVGIVKRNSRLRRE